MRQSRMFSIWWDGLMETEAHNGYNPSTDEHYAQIRIGRLHFCWGVSEDQ